MAPEWTPPGPSHYERADTALGIVGKTLAEFPEGHPEGGQANTLMILAMVAQARASLAVADRLARLIELGERG
jgi:hypothetical protein